VGERREYASKESVIVTGRVLRIKDAVAGGKGSTYIACKGGVLVQIEYVRIRSSDGRFVKISVAIY
jgi:hypothetical protein